MKLFLLVCLLFYPTALLSQQTGFLNRSVNINGNEYPYQVFVPEQWMSEQQWPVIFFLHGAGESGSDGKRQTKRGLPKLLRNDPDFPALVVMPQCRRHSWWGEPEMEAQAFAALGASMKEFNGDPARLYLTGLSMGGYGAWAFAYKYPERFAALVPICGGVQGRSGFPPPSWHPASRAPDDPYSETARALRDLPIWIFHGDADQRVPVSESRQMKSSLEDIGGNVKYTEYPDVGHNSWDLAYREEDLIPWMLSFKKKSR